MKIAEIYNKMIEEELTYLQILALKVDDTKPNTVQGLRSQVVRYCKENSLPLPAGKRGRKRVDINIKLKGE